MRGPVELAVVNLGKSKSIKSLKNMQRLFGTRELAFVGKYSNSLEELQVVNYPLLWETINLGTRRWFLYVITDAFKSMWCFPLSKQYLLNVL